MNADTLLAFDPGLSKAGAAVFKEGRLSRAILFKRDQSRHKDAAAWIRMADLVLAHTPRQGYRVDLAYEMMQKDKRSQGAKIASIMQLCGVTGAVAWGFGNRVHGYTPSRWNKNRPKAQNHAKILRALDDAETEALLAGRIEDPDSKTGSRDLFSSKIDASALYQNAISDSVGQAEHVLDAVGIGLYHLDRLL